MHTQGQRVPYGWGSDYYYVCAWHFEFGELSIATIYNIETQYSILKRHFTVKCQGRCQVRLIPTTRVDGPYVNGTLLLFLIKVVPNCETRLVHSSFTLQTTS